MTTLEKWYSKQFNKKNLKSKKKKIFNTIRMPKDKNEEGLKKYV
jgi:hypothetical protein